jgi:hypothetical protein
MMRSTIAEHYVYAYNYLASNTDEISPKGHVSGPFLRRENAEQAAAALLGTGKVARVEFKIEYSEGEDDEHEG